MNDELLSEVIAAILESNGHVNVAQKDTQVVACSFEPPNTLKKLWSIAVETARKLRPELEDDIDDDWSINLFTTEGLWEFPK